VLELREYGDGEHEQPTEWKRLAMASAGSVSRISEKQMLASRYRMQIRASTRKRRSTEWSCDGMLRQHKSEYIALNPIHDFLSCCCYYCDFLYIIFVLVREGGRGGGGGMGRKK
jgi:hypothetical protein